MDFSQIMSSLGGAMQQGSGGDGAQMAGLGSFGLRQQQYQRQPIDQQQPQRMSLFDLLQHYDQDLRQRIGPQQNFLTGGY